ncbi:transposase [bacterium]|nr:transposase [bacterium]
MSEEFIEKYRYRAGIEGTNSCYKRKTGVEHLRYRGLKKVRFAVKTKALGINIFRVVNYCRIIRKREENNYSIQPKFCLNYLFVIIFSVIIINFIAFFREKSENRLVYCH